MADQPKWVAWASVLAGLSVAAAAASWGRTLIPTEVWALHHATRPLEQHLEAIRQDLVHPPLIYLFHRLWLSTLGQSDSAAKLLPLVINIPTIFLFTLLSTRVTRKWRLASFLFAGIYCTAASPATQVRMYGLGLLWTVVLMLLWDEWRRRPTAGRLALWAAAMTLQVYTHFFGLLLLAAFCIVNLLFGTRQRAFTAEAAGVGLLYLPWLLFVWPVYQSRGLDANLWWVHMLLRNPLIAAAQLQFEFLGHIQIPGWRLILVVAAGIVHLLLAAAAAVHLRSTRIPAPQSAPWVRICLILTGAPLGLLLLLSVTVTLALTSRFAYGVLPAYWLLVVLLGEAGGRMGRTILCAAVVPWVLAASGVALSQHWGASPFKSATSIVAPRVRPGDLVLSQFEIGSFVYWEWAHRLRRTERVEIAGPSPREGLSVEERLGVVQGKRLSVPRPVDLAALNLGDSQRVWLFHQNAAILDSVASWLGQRGFVRGPTIGVETIGVTGFARSTGLP